MLFWEVDGDQEPRKQDRKEKHEPKHALDRVQSPEKLHVSLGISMRFDRLRITLPHVANRFGNNNQLCLASIDVAKFLAVKEAILF